MLRIGDQFLAFRMDNQVEVFQWYVAAKIWDVAAEKAYSAMADVPDGRRSAFPRREAQPDGAGAPHARGQTGLLGTVADR